MFELCLLLIVLCCESVVHMSVVFHPENINRGSDRSCFIFVILFCHHISIFGWEKFGQFFFDYEVFYKFFFYILDSHRRVPRPLTTSIFVTGLYKLIFSIIYPLNEASHNDNSFPSFEIFFQNRALFNYTIQSEWNRPRHSPHRRVEFLNHFTFFYDKLLIYDKK